MDDIQSYKMYEEIVKNRNFYEQYANAHANYKNTLRAFDKLLFELDDTLLYSKIRMLAKSRQLTDDLLQKTPETRLDFVQRNALHNLDVENLSKILVNYVGNNIPTLELFPGSGQFLPHVVASEPLYIADRYSEINDFAAQSLNNEFYSTRRLRKYTIEDFNLSQFPSESFGLIYCFNEFFYADQNYILNWARGIYNFLYDGGRFIFNFIPHDEFWAIEYTLGSNYSVIDYKDLIKNLEDFGYELESYKIQPARSSYIIVKRPGNLEERIKIRGGYAEIIDN
jgi:hypothetical protein